MTHPQGCPLCEGDGGIVIARNAKWRLVRAKEEGFPAFYRVIWNDHVREFTDLPPQDRIECMETVSQVETLMRSHLQPDKVNLATLGNAVPHLHWHVIARFAWDSHFPGAVWAAAQRPVDHALVASLEQRIATLEIDLGKLARTA